MEDAERCWPCLRRHVQSSNTIFKYKFSNTINCLNISAISPTTFAHSEIPNLLHCKIALIPQTKQPGRAGGHWNEKLAGFFSLFSLKEKMAAAAPMPKDYEAQQSSIYLYIYLYIYTAPSVFTLKLPTIKSHITSVQSRGFHSAGNSISNTETIHAAPGLHLSSPGMKQRIMRVISWSQSLKLLFSRLYEDICY